MQLSGPFYRNESDVEPIENVFAAILFVVLFIFCIQSRETLVSAEFWPKFQKSGERLIIKTIFFVSIYKINLILNWSHMIINKTSCQTAVSVCVQSKSAIVSPFRRLFTASGFDCCGNVVGVGSPCRVGSQSTVRCCNKNISFSL